MRGKKKKRAPESAEDERPPPAPAVATPLGRLLAGVKISPVSPEPKSRVPDRARPPSRSEARARPTPATEAAVVARPSSGLRGHDRTAFFDAMVGVRPIGDRGIQKRVVELPPAPLPLAAREADRVARARLAALVADGLRFEIRRDDGWVAGVRSDAPAGTLEALSRTSETEADLDLHGRRTSEVESLVAAFVRAAHHRGRRRLRVVHGKGLHSDASGPVLGDAVIDALTRGGAAPLVLAFVTPAAHLGGAGALVVVLAR